MPSMRRAVWRELGVRLGVRALKWRVAGADDLQICGHTCLLYSGTREFTLSPYALAI